MEVIFRVRLNERFAQLPALPTGYAVGKAASVAPMTAERYMWGVVETKRIDSAIARLCIYAGVELHDVVDVVVKDGD